MNGAVVCGDHNPRRDAAKSAARVQRRSMRRHQDEKGADKTPEGKRRKKKKRDRSNSAGRKDATINSTGKVDPALQDTEPYNPEDFDFFDFENDDDDEQDDDYTPSQKRKRLTSSAPSTMSREFPYEGKHSQPLRAEW